LCFRALLLLYTEISRELALFGAPFARTAKWLSFARLGMQLKKDEFMPHPVDVHVGKRVRHRRWLIGMTQQQLAERVGIKFQQIQKYETGANRVSASRLWDIADALDVDVSFFFEGLETQGAAREDAAEGVPADILGDKEALDLVRSYYSIPENQRRRLFDLARVLSDVA